MADTPWTPGPWRNVAGELVGADGQRVVLAAFRGGLVSAHGNPRAVANTAIAEAAPEMAEVLDGTTGAFMAALLEIMAARLVMLGAAEDDDIVVEAKHRAAKTRALLARIKGEAS